MAKCNCVTEYYKPTLETTFAWQCDEASLTNAKSNVAQDFEVWLADLYLSYKSYDNSREIDLNSRGSGPKTCWLIDKGTYEIKSATMEPQDPFASDNLNLPDPPEDEETTGNHTCAAAVQARPDKCPSDCINTNGGALNPFPDLLGGGGPNAGYDCKTLKEEIVDEKQIPLKIQFKAVINPIIEFGCKDAPANSQWAYSLDNGPTFDDKTDLPDVAVRIILIKKELECCVAYAKKHTCP
jgi:hypothetical protein